MITFIPAQNDDIVPEITPLLDVVFILLIFFILVAAFSVHGLDMSVPEAKTGRAVSGRVVEICLKKDGSIYAEKKRITRDDLKFFIHKTVKSFSRNPGKILLKSDPLAPVGDLVFILDIARAQGSEDLVLATISSENE